jgi:hypothetical protein
MLDDLANRGDFSASVEPVFPVDLANRLNGHLLDRQISTQHDQPIDIPRIESLLGRPEALPLGINEVSPIRFLASGHSQGDRLAVTTGSA